MGTVLEQLHHYVGFGEVDEAALRALHPIAQPHFASIAERFYARVLDEPDTRATLERGASTLGRLQITLQGWMDLLLRGPWDEFYYETRARIGRVHIRVALPQHYMFGAMSVIRQELNQIVDDHYREDFETKRHTVGALGKALDLELAIMLHTYREDQLIQHARLERLSTFGQLVGSIGHELRNPLGVIESSLYILRGRVQSDPRAAKHIDRIEDQLAASNHIINNLLDMIRERPLAKERFALSSAVASACETLRLTPGAPLLRENLTSTGEVEGDPSQLRQLFINLLQNAAHAAGERGEIRVSAVDEAEAIEVAIEDTGPGVAAAVRDRLFEPVTTPKKPGVGLGLALARRIIERHQGNIRYEPRTAGARFVVRLPLA